MTSSSASSEHRTWTSAGPASAFGARPSQATGSVTLYQAVCEVCGRLGLPQGSYDKAVEIRELHELELELRHKG